MMIVMVMIIVRPAHQRLIKSILLGHELIVRSDLHNGRSIDRRRRSIPGTQHDNPIGILDRGKTMRNDDGGDTSPRPALSDQIVDCRLHHPFGFIVQRRSGLVQNEHRRSAYQRPGNGDALFLPPAQFGSARAHFRVEFVGKRRDEVVGVGRSGGRFDLFHRGGFGPGLAPGDVGGDGIVEEEGFLGHDADVIAHGSHVEIA
mmetsp:Transcript_7385/g.12435  ORF Transcript_7385/g.12435 Transcript_7385/m.12435 type:complete len:202 (-) Transcript_7385:322-927(-)